MNRSELRGILTRKHVDESLYSLEGPARQSESYSIVKDGNSWKVVYKERGESINIGVNLSEDEACALVFRLFKDAFGWTEEAIDQ